MMCQVLFSDLESQSERHGADLKELTALQGWGWGRQKIVALHAIMHRVSRKKSV